MDLSRARALVAWATASLTLASIVYAPEKFVEWSDERRAWERTSEPDRRNFLWLISDHPPNPWRYEPDYSRMIGELVLIIGIGGGLIFALREKR
jgi:hypothetical protein